MFTRVESDPSQELIASIAPDVMKCFDRVGFFERLDDLLCAKTTHIIPRIAAGTVNTPSPFCERLDLCRHNWRIFLLCSGPTADSVIARTFTTLPIRTGSRPNTGVNRQKGENLAKVTQVSSGGPEIVRFLDCLRLSEG
jgi:hypothetical protein